MGGIIERIKSLRREVIFFLKFGRKIKKLRNRKEKIFVCVDSAVHGNMGDQALGFCRLKFLQSIGIPPKNILEYTARDRMRFWTQIRKAHKESDILILRGGGCWGNLWQDGFDSILSYIGDFSKNPIIVFPQSVYFSEDETGRKLLEQSKIIINAATSLTICARDKHSEKLLRQYYPTSKVLVMPDTVLSYKPRLSKESGEAKQILLCLREDKEKKHSIDIEKELRNIGNDVIVEFQDTNIDFNLRTILEREKKLFALWGRFSQAKCVITDRLHGMIFSTILGVPCIVLDNIDGKVGHQYEWIKNLNYVKYVETVEQFGEAYKYISNCERAEYPLEQILPLFDELKSCLLNYR